MSRISTLALIAGTVAVALVATKLVAQEQMQPPQANMPGTMQDGGMMPMMGMMQQMSEMMETCNKMMQARTTEPAPDAPSSQPPTQQ